MTKKVCIKIKDKNRIYITFPYDRELITGLKNIPGYRWHPESTEWSFPFQFNTTILIKKLFNGYKIIPDKNIKKFSNQNPMKNSTDL